MSFRNPDLDSTRSLDLSSESLKRPTSLLLRKHVTISHVCADDVQAFVHGSPANQLSVVSSVDAHSHDLQLWML